VNGLFKGIKNEYDSETYQPNDNQRNQSFFEKAKVPILRRMEIK